MRSSIEIRDSEVPALFGYGTYGLTAFKLAHRKLGNLPPDSAQSDRAVIARNMTSAIREMFGDLYGVIVSPAVSEYGGSIAPILSVPHARILRPPGGGRESVPAGREWAGELLHEQGVGGMLCLSVDPFVWEQDWTAGATVPPYVDLRVQAMLMACSFQWAAIAVLVGGSELYGIPRLINQPIAARIAETVNAFVADLAAGRLPAETLPQDVDVVKHLYRSTTPGKLLDASDDSDWSVKCRYLVSEYTSARDAEKTAKEWKDTVNAKLLQHVGDAERILVPGYNVSFSMIAPTWIEAHERAGSRRLNITKKRVKT